MIRSEMFGADVQSFFNRYGYQQFGGGTDDFETTAEYAHTQEVFGARRWDEYFRPLVLSEPVRRAADIGCGTGELVEGLLAAGMDAYGFDLPSLSPWWAKLGRDTRRYFAGDALHLPMEDDVFDVVVSAGVIEHIGQMPQGWLLADDYWDQRRAYARELLRVTRPGGRLIVSCPNKSFPIDMQHGPAGGGAIRVALYERTKINVHRTWGKHHLLSVREARELFLDAGAKSVEPLPLRKYFGFASFERHGRAMRSLGRLAEFYVDHLPRSLLMTCLNPYMLVLVRK